MSKEIAHREKKIYEVTIAGSLVNLFLVLFKFVSGILGHSAAMIADATHSLSDFITDIIVIIFVRLSAKPEDEDHKYGHGKYETLASQIIGMALAGAGLMIFWNAVTRIWAFVHGEIPQSPGVIALVAAALSIILKEIIFRITRKTAKEINSSSLEANAWHHRSDALSSIGTLLGIGGSIFLGRWWKSCAILDPIAAIIVSIFIVITAFKIIAEASGELLEKSLPSESEQKICELVYEDPEICDVHRLRTRKIGSRIAIEMHLRLPGEMPVREAHEHATEIEGRLKEEFGQSTIIMLHIEPKKEN